MQACSAESPRRTSPMVRRFAFTLAVSVFAGGCGHSQSSSDQGDYRWQIAALAGDQGPTDPLVQSQLRGSAVYEHYCLICHGVGGQGNGFNASLLDSPPRNFAEEAFWQNVDDEHLFAAISGGGKAVNKSVLMPAWGHTLAEQQIRDVIAYLRTAPELAKQSETEEEAIEEEEADK